MANPNTISKKITESLKTQSILTPRGQQYPHQCGHWWLCTDENTKSLQFDQGYWGSPNEIPEKHKKKRLFWVPQQGRVHRLQSGRRTQNQGYYALQKILKNIKKLLFVHPRKAFFCMYLQHIVHNKNCPGRTKMKHVPKGAA